jgi:hypothetical protein
MSLNSQSCRSSGSFMKDELAKSILIGMKIAISLLLHASDLEMSSDFAIIKSHSRLNFR